MARKIRKNSAKRIKKRRGKFVISKEMTIAEVMKKRPDAMIKLLEMGLGCGGCRFAMVETLEQGCVMHGLDIEKVLKKLNDA